MQVSCVAVDRRPEQAVHPHAFGPVQSVQLLRFFAALLVVIQHAQVISGEILGQNPDWVAYITEFGQSGVHIFFVISGFIMCFTAGYKGGTKGAPGQFLLRRMIRIFPIYWLAVLIELALRAALGDPYHLSGSSMIAAFLLLPEYAHLVIGQAWTLSYEVYFYLCFGLALLVTFHRGLLLLSFWFLASIAAGQIIGLEGPLSGLWTNTLLLEFLFGAWTGALFLAGWRIGERTAILLLGLAALGFAGSLVVDYRTVPTVVVWGLPSALLVGSLVGRELNGGAPRWIRKYAFLGDGSYSLYLMHAIVIELVFLAASALGATTSAALLWALIAVCTSVFVGMAVYRLIEYPLLSALRRTLASR